MDPITAIVTVGSQLITRLFPDPAQAAQANLELTKMQMSGELAQLTEQTGINKIEAASTSIFVSGWRPFVGWVCGLGLGYVAIIEPIARFVATMLGYTGAFPTIDTTLTMQVLIGMLGLGGLRSLDKAKGVASK
jgi:hypothetical protein